MTAQEKLNKIDELLNKSGVCEPDTLAKVISIIKERDRFKKAYLDNEDTLCEIARLAEYD